MSRAAEMQVELDRVWNGLWDRYMEILDPAGWDDRNRAADIVDDVANAYLRHDPRFTTEPRDWRLDLPRFINFR